MMFKLALALLLTMNVAGAPSDASVRKQLDLHLQKAAAADRFSGTVLVARNDKVLFAKAYGLASIEHRVPNTIETKFKIYSTTKPFTATAILLLEQDGKLRVTDSVCKHLSECPPAWNPVTIEHLLTHTSGIKDFTNAWFEEWKTSNLDTYKRLAPKLTEALVAAPGAAWAYSNTGYELLGCILENVTGTQYPDFLRARIFTPLGMSATGVELTAPIEHRDYEGPVPVASLASGYNGQPGQPERAWSVMYKLMAAGGIYSNVRDLFRFSLALDSDALLNAGSRERMFKPFIDRYGYGWVVSRKFGRRYVRHDGGNNGYNTTIDRYPDDGITLIVLSNRGYVDMGELRTALAAIVFGEDPANASK